MPLTIEEFIRKQKEIENKKQKPKKPRVVYERLENVYDSYEVFKRDNPDEFFKQRKVVDKDTGRVQYVFQLDKNGNRIPIQKPTASKWEIIEDGDERYVVSKDIIKDLRNLVGKANIYNMERFYDLKREYQNLPSQQRQKQTLEQYIKSWLGSSAIEEVKTVDANGVVHTDIKFKEFRSASFIPEQISKMRERYSLSTSIQKVKTTLMLLASDEYKQRRDTQYRDNFVDYAESFLGEIDELEVIKTMEPNRFRPWFETALLPQMVRLNVAVDNGESGSFNQPYTSGQDAPDDWVERLLQAIRIAIREI